MFHMRSRCCREKNQCNMCIFPQIWTWWIWAFDHSQKGDFCFEVMGIKTINDSLPTLIPMASHWDQTVYPTSNTHTSHFHFVQTSTTTRQRRKWTSQRGTDQATGPLMQSWLKNDNNTLLMCWFGLLKSFPVLWDMLPSESWDRLP